MNDSGFIAWMGLVLGGVSLVWTIRNSLSERARDDLLKRHEFNTLRLAWANDVIDAMASAGTLLYRKSVKDEDVSKETLDLQTRLSALLDRGRLFFPNIAPDLEGVGKEPAYRGLRPTVLSYVFKAYDLVSKLHVQGDIEPAKGLKELTIIRRQFVSETQRLLGVRKQVEKFEELFSEG